MRKQVGIILFVIFLLVWIVGAILLFNDDFSVPDYIGLLLLSIFALICALSVLISWFTLFISAFRDDSTTGLLFLFVPFYWIYYAISKYNENNRGIVLTMCFGGFLGATISSICIFAMGVIEYI